MKNKTELTS